MRRDLAAQLDDLGARFEDADSGLRWRADRGLGDGGVARSGVDFGMRIASSSRSKAAVSASTAASISSFSVCARTAMRSRSVCFDSKPFFVCDSTATIAARPAAIDAASAETEPPPGAGESLESSSTKSRTRIDARRGGCAEAVLDDALARIERFHFATGRACGSRCASARLRGRRSGVPSAAR